MINSKRKGKVGEREVVLFLHAEGFNARRGQQFRGGPGSPDVICDDFPDTHLEVKRRRHMACFDWYKQAQRDAGTKRPAVWQRANGCEEFWVSEPASVWCDKMRKLLEMGDDKTETGNPS